MKLRADRKRPPYTVDVRVRRARDVVERRYGGKSGVVGVAIMIRDGRPGVCVQSTRELRLPAKLAGVPVWQMDVRSAAVAAQPETKKRDAKALKQGRLSHKSSRTAV